VLGFLLRSKKTVMAKDKTVRTQLDVLAKGEAVPFRIAKFKQ